MDHEQEFLKAYDLYSDAIFRHCFFRVFDREVARDLVQETFMKTWEYLQKGHRIDNFRAFLYKVATNLIIDYSRKKKEISLDALKEQGFDPVVQSREKADIFDIDAALSAIRNLPDKYREVVTMRHVDDLSPAEIAQILGESENTISVRIHRGIKHIKQI